MVTAYQNTERQKQRKIKKLVWNMICSASDENISPLITEEYTQLDRLGWKFTNYKKEYEYISPFFLVDQIMFVLMIYYSLTTC